jgi:hypothetical protein
MNFIKHFFLFCLLALCASLTAAAQNASPDDLQSLSDEFTDEKSLANWKQFHEVEGWRSMIKTLDVNKTTAGSLHLEPSVAGWFEDYQGAFIFKEVTGNFLVTARVKTRGKETEMPTALWSLAGLMVRAPRPEATKDKWQPRGENWLFFTTGVADPVTQPVFESKTTGNSKSNLKLRPAKTGWVELGIARVRSAFILLYRYDGETKWTVHERFHRRDLPRAVQVGLNAYSGGSTHEEQEPFKFNTMQSKNGKADLILNVDYVRFRRLNYEVSSPRSDASDLTDYSLTSDELLKKLGL